MPPLCSVQPAWLFPSGSCLPVRLFFSAGPRRYGVAAGAGAGSGCQPPPSAR